MAHEAVGAHRDVAIRVTDLHEVFRIYSEVPPGLKERLAKLRRANYTEFHALNGIDLVIHRGERVGLIGHNGSGKSTLLKCMAKILPADRGSVETNGRVATLLELGAGFNPELTGRENMYLNGSILGMSRAEIDANFDAIVDFAGVRDFIDTPVKHYSSGMYVRLGFAIAVHVDPDILLVDEVLAVGDATFQERSLGRMRAFAEAGKTVVLVSHDLASIGSLCDRVVLLEQGRVAFDGPTGQALAEYERRLAQGRGETLVLPTAQQQEDAAEDDPDDDGDHAAEITAVRLDVAGVDADQPVPTGSKARLDIEVTARDQLIGAGGLYVRFRVRRPDLDPPIYDSRTSWRVTYVAPPPPGAVLRCGVDFELNVLTGTYLVDVEVGNAETDVVHHHLAEAARVVVASEPHDAGIAPLGVTFTLDNPDGVWPPESEPPGPDEGGPAVHPSPLWPLGEPPPTRRGGP